MPPVAPTAGINNNYHSLSAPTWPYFNTYTPLIKVDHSFSDKEKLSVSYTNEIRHRLLSGNTVGFAAPPAWGAQQKNPLDDYFDQLANSWKVRINLDSVITPALLNHVTLSADRYINWGPNGTDGQGWDQKLGITGIPADNGSLQRRLRAVAGINRLTVSGERMRKTGMRCATLSTRISLDQRQARFQVRGRDRQEPGNPVHQAWRSRLVYFQQPVYKLECK